VAKIAGDFGVKEMGLRSADNDKPHYDPIEVSGPKIQSGEIGIGNIYTRVIDQATGFATLAARGVEADPYFVAKVINTRDDKVTYTATPKTHKVTTVTQDKIDDTTYVLQQVLKGTSKGARQLAPGPGQNDPRPAAVKTGTTQFDKAANLDAWMVGYTPQLATAVWDGYDHFKELKDEKGNPIYGAGLPGMAWKAFMDQALKGQPVKKFADPQHVGDATKGMNKGGALVQGGGDTGDNNGDNNGGNNTTPQKCIVPGFPVGCQGGNDGGNQGGGGNHNGGGGNSPSPNPTSTCSLLNPRCRPTN
jgi:membrane peptidoglycan carboxypeptidase